MPPESLTPPEGLHFSYPTLFSSSYSAFKVTISAISYFSASSATFPSFASSCRSLFTIVTQFLVSFFESDCILFGIQCLIEDLEALSSRVQLIFGNSDINGQCIQRACLQLGKCGVVICKFIQRSEGICSAFCPPSSSLCNRSSAAEAACTPTVFPARSLSCSIPEFSATTITWLLSTYGTEKV